MKPTLPVMWIGGLLAGALFGAPAGAATPLPRDFPSLAEIQSAELMATVEYLASPALQGRLSGSPGFMTAAREMADRFQALGLEPVGDDGYFQHLEVEYNDITECALGLMRPDGTLRDFQIGPDFACRGLTGSAEITAPVVFVGYGVSRPESGYDDYAGIDTRGKVVLAFKEEPPFTADSTGWGKTTLPRPKGLVAAAHGAVALLIVPRPRTEHPQPPIASMLEGEGEQDLGFPRMQISVDTAREICAAGGVPLEDLQSRIDSTKTPASREVGASVRIQVSADYAPKQPTVNVVGRLPSADPARSRQCVVMGAHLDHVGAQAGRVYYPGANDNASGSAALLSVAQAVARGGVRPARTILFAFLASEEAGLYGAKRFVASPPVPLDSIVVYMNLDCVGHGDSVRVGGGKTSPKLWEMVRALDAADRKLLVAESGAGGGADAAPFFEAKIRTLYFDSKFSYTYLHQPGDTPATLNPPLLETVARLAYRVAWRIAQGAWSPEEETEPIPASAHDD